MLSKQGIEISKERGIGKKNLSIGFKFYLVLNFVSKKKHRNKDKTTHTIQILEIFFWIVLTKREEERNFLTQHFDTNEIASYNIKKIIPVSVYIYFIQYFEGIFNMIKNRKVKDAKNCFSIKFFFKAKV